MSFPKHRQLLEWRIQRWAQEHGDKAIVAVVVGGGHYTVLRLWISEGIGSRVLAPFAIC